MQLAGGVELLIGAHTRLCVYVNVCVCLPNYAACVSGRRSYARVKQNYFPPRVQINPGRKNCRPVLVGNDEK